MTKHTESNRIIVPDIPLSATGADEFCTSLVKAKTVPYWWYFGDACTFSLPFRHDGIWWYQVKRGFAWAVDIYQPVVSVVRLPLKKTFIGYQYATSGEYANSSQLINTVTNVGQYDEYIDLDAKRRNAIRKGLRNCTVEKATKFTPEMIGQVYELWKNFTSRTGWKYPFKYQYVDESLQRLVGLPGTTVLLANACDQPEKIIGILIVKVINTTAYVDTIASDSGFLSHNPNDALLYTFIMNVKKLPHVRNIHYAIKSYDVKLEVFKESFGFKKVSVPCRTVLRPGMKTALRLFKRDMYDRLIGNI